MSVINFPAKSSRSIAFMGAHNPLLQTRAMNSLSMELLDIIKLVTLDPRMPPNLVGSFKYIIHEYPADIDMFEAYVHDGSISSTGHYVAERFASIAQNIKNMKGVYLGDFKAGVDERFEVDIGYINPSSGKLVGYHPTKIRERIINIHERGLLADNEADEWLRAVVLVPSILEYLDLDALIRKKYVIRWTVDELIAKKKTLAFGKIIKLETAVLQKSIIKIDIWARLQKRFMEITNFYDLRYRNNTGEVAINLDASSASSYESSLVGDLHHYSNLELGKAMKLTKRLWLYAIMKKDQHLLRSLYPLFGSGAAKMYQILGEIETIENILAKVKKPVIRDILENMEDWKARLGTITNDILPGHIAYEIFKRINASLMSKNKKDILNTLDYLSDKLTIYVNKYVIEYLKKARVNIKNILA
jgi:hypothetical protein